MRESGEFRRNWRPFLGAFLGVGSALSLNSYILSTFAPYLIKEFGWSRSQFAMLGVVQIFILVCMPIAGRLTDMFGVRRTAAVGALSFPLFLCAIATMSGDIGLYLWIFIAQTIICSTTTTTVYSRVVAEVFTLRRGLALGLCGSGPPLIGALGSPLISAFVESHGWRAGYLVVAAFCAICAVITLMLLPSHKKEPSLDRTAVKRPVGVYGEIFKMPVFWLMLCATFLVNMPFSLATSQLKLVVLEQGLNDGAAALLVSAFAIGSLVGRVLSGAALDYLPGHVVAGIGFGLPVAGLLLLASSLNSMPFVAIAIVLIGLSFGGEGDIIPFLVTRYFGIPIYSTVLGLLTAGMGTAMAMGNVILGLTLQSAAGFLPYLLIAALGSFIGSIGFLMLGHPRFRQSAQAPEPAA